MIVAGDEGGRVHVLCLEGTEEQLKDQAFVTRA
jgi:hypothetical protein